MLRQREESEIVKRKIRKGKRGMKKGRRKIHDEKKLNEMKKIRTRLTRLLKLPRNKTIEISIKKMPSNNPSI